MKFGFVYPGGLPQQAIAFAKEAEAAGWDGFFVWEPVFNTAFIGAAVQHAGSQNFFSTAACLFMLEEWS